jgi:serine/threonine-protein kinase
MLSGKWHIDRLLGSGGTSSVFAATHRNGKRVAIKVLSAELSASARFRRRFLREGYIANRVGHEGAVSVLDDDEAGGLVFLVMELLEGRSLEDLRSRRGGTLPAHEVVAVALELLAVLGSAHANGIVHRDVKPSNVFLTVRREVKLLDFGIASLREVPGVSTQTMTGVMLGTPGFMAPEQARGRWDELTPATDIWAVGATMFRLLSGSLVHEEETSSETMIAAATRPPRSIVTLCPELPSPIVQVIDRALELDPSARWTSAEAMLQELRRSSEGLPALALPELGEGATVESHAAATRDESLSVPAESGPDGMFGSPTIMGEPPGRKPAGLLRTSTGGRYGRLALVGFVALALGGVSWLGRERRGAGDEVASSVRAPVAVPEESARPEPSALELPTASAPSAPAPPAPSVSGAAPPRRVPVSVRKPAPTPSKSAEAPGEDLLRERL